MEFFKHGFVHFAEGVAFFVIGKIERIDNVDDFAKKHTVFHVLIGISESGLDDGFFNRSFGGNFDSFELYISGSVFEVFAFQNGEKRVVDEIQELFSG